MTGPDFCVAPLLVALGRVLAYTGFSMGPNGEPPADEVDFCECRLPVEPVEYVPAKGPLGGEEPLDILGELLPPAKDIPDGRVWALPTLILGLYVFPR